jgi:hypothetical protein
MFVGDTLLFLSMPISGLSKFANGTSLPCTELDSTLQRDESVLYSKHERNQETATVFLNQVFAGKYYFAEYYIRSSADKCLKIHEIIKV